tara:strand:- start:600 stop:758 length:159 start_codon:yes stop_codon:yes gene_type:complete
MSKRFTLQIQEDEYGDPLIYLPHEVIEELDWTTGDTLEYNTDNNALNLKRDG